MLKVVLLLALVLCCSSRSINWTGGAGNGLWHFAGNWQGNTVPTLEDDVFINAVGGASVSISQPAVALSVTIGGGSYAQSLNLLSQLTVGGGGITVQNGGTIQVSTNNDLPLTSKGRVTVLSGGVFSFNSGAVVDTVVVINSGGSLTFATSALKFLSASSFTSYGNTVIQSSVIQFGRGATLVSSGNLTAVGQISLFTLDNTGSFVSNGQFNYQGSSNTQPLDFQVPAYFSSDINISGGALIFSHTVNANGTINVPSGAIFTVAGGPTTKTIFSIRGQGTFNVQGTAVVNSIVNIDTFTVQDGGEVTLRSTSTVRSVTISGKVTISTTLIGQIVVLAGATVGGAGNLTSSVRLEIQPSMSGNTNNFISNPVYIMGNGTISKPVYILMSGMGDIHIGKSSTFTITAGSNIGVQSGNPMVTVDGTLVVALPSNNALVSNANFAGAGVLLVQSGKVEFDSDTVSFSRITISAGAVVDFETARFTIGDVTGTGSLNVTAAPSPYSSFGKVSVNYLGIPNGNIYATSIAVNTFDFWNGMLTLSSGSANSADTFRFYGGALHGVAKLNSKTLTIRGNIPQVINGTVITTNTFMLSCPTMCTLLTENGASISASSTSFSTPVITPGKVSIQD